MIARVLPVAVVVLLAAACQRIPEEPAPTPVFTANVSASASGEAPAIDAPRGSPPSPSAHRCIVQTPAEAPPSVPAGPAPGCPADPGGVGALPRVTLEFPDENALHARVELARADSELERGLMYRKHMDDDAGMIFRMGHEVHTFWMHNTCIPLDMLFLDTDGVIVGIVENAPTLDDGPRSVACSSTWVLEMNAGWSRRHGVKAGQRVTIPPDALQ